MSSRDLILSKIKAVPLEAKDLPTIPEFEFEGDLKARFIASIQANKGEVISKEEFLSLLDSKVFEKVYSRIEDFSSFTNIRITEDAHHLDDLNLAIIRGQFGVAENGAIWLEDQDMGLRALPFITEHLVIVLDSAHLVANMHHAYDRIGLQESGFGLFIAGPSKTADIEQSLVIGAHGAKSLRVVLV
ncbi:LutC/YkgG family protein [Aquiflexum gelatinilyticum]|uniref:LutC/YkgG family protein n=1 Tax=Aquiflexum gelatinilyticum TaxID=2961943 RepID=UPI002168B66C|nr:LUD domain-containing protein [Aquiflexum gelatinilyticum]MCS4436090.1 LUD domain-containing protein [Aquiflexum gelatinilyticum]